MLVRTKRTAIDRARWSEPGARHPAAVPDRGRDSESSQGGTGSPCYAPRALASLHPQMVDIVVPWGRGLGFKAAGTGVVFGLLPAVKAPAGRRALRHD